MSTFINASTRCAVLVFLVGCNGANGGDGDAGTTDGPDAPVVDGGAPADATVGSELGTESGAPDGMAPDSMAPDAAWPLDLPVPADSAVPDLTPPPDLTPAPDVVAPADLIPPPDQGPPPPSCGYGCYDNGLGTCVGQGCASGFHDGGDGLCVPVAACSTGYHDGGDGTCTSTTTCAAGYTLDSSGACVTGPCLGEGVRSGVTSANAKASACYLERRSTAALKAVGALTPIMSQVLQRIAAYGKDFSVDSLLYVEDPARYATFLPAEQAAFPALWALLELAPSIDVNMAAPHPPLASLIERTAPIPAALDIKARVNISELSAGIQSVAQHVVKTPGAPTGTISFEEVVTALANFQIYPSSDFFYFGSVLRGIEGLLLKPASFPHLAYLGDPATDVTVTVGGAQVLISRKINKESCDVGSFSQAQISTWSALTFSVPSGSSLIWTPLAKDATLQPRSSSYPSSVEVLPHAGVTSFRVKGNGRQLALVDLWTGGARTAQALVITAGDEGVYGKGLGIVKNGALACLPFEDQAAASDSLSNIIRVPPGQYQVPAGSYGTAILNIYGRNVMRLDIDCKRFWNVQQPTPSSSVSETCWELTELGPHNMVTGQYGPGPGFRFEYDTNQIYYDPTSYGICFGSGTLVTTLDPNNRL